MRRKIQSPKLTPAQREVEAIRKTLKHYTVEKEPEYWLQPAYPQLSEVFGDPSRGIPYGKIYEICGRFSGGKSAIVMELAAMAQSDGAHVVWIDHETSFDEKWATVRGLDTDRVALFQPSVVKKGKSDMRLLSAEDLYEEAELYVKYKIRKDPKAKIFMGIDSVAAILSAQQIDNTLEDGRRGVLAAFLSKMLNRWSPMVFTHNIMMVMINQVRVNPGVRFGDPVYRPGGNAIDHYTSVVAQVKRSRSKEKGYVVVKGKRIGIKGTVVNVKNKVGGMEDAKIGFKIYRRKRGKFVNFEEVE